MRAVLPLAAACSLLLACSPKSSPPAEAPPDAGADGPVDTAPPSWNQQVTPPDDTTAASTRAACGYSAGALPLATQGASQPDGSTIPIDTIVVVMMENRSFDHYFEDLPSIGFMGADLAPPGTTNPGVDGGAVPFVHGTQLSPVPRK